MTELDEIKRDLHSHLEAHKEYGEASKKLSEGLIVITNDLSEIKMAVIGSKTLGIKGVIQTVDSHSEFIDKLKEENVIQKVHEQQKYIEKDRAQKNRIIGAWAVISFLFICGFELIKYFIEKK